MGRCRVGVRSEIVGVGIAFGEFAGDRCRPNEGVCSEQPPAHAIMANHRKLADFLVGLNGGDGGGAVLQVLVALLRRKLRWGHAAEEHGEVAPRLGLVQHAEDLFFRESLFSLPFLCERTLHRFRTNHGEQVTSSLTGCAAPARVGVEYCDHARPIYFDSAAQVGKTSGELPGQILRRNETWRAWCGGRKH